VSSPLHPLHWTKGYRGLDTPSMRGGQGGAGGRDDLGRGQGLVGKPARLPGLHL